MDGSSRVMKDWPVMEVPRADHSLWLYCRKTKMNYMDVVDMIAVATPITACFIRLANLMNSEIIGKVTDVSWHSFSNG